ncbi:hypothetical protein GCK72_025928 [Caenorhabditis remanei]|uniref:Uncharacterized protein n=1 Tax=Caenorhabditis remanei TaxID=31234 RepID=A0A6A5G3H4_CAERE|nr:hypothetical protein GCK72_025928 [Caenorhabditis remanei]KAF1749460.1 hypothetical protein GCK72_025928 [Caenorhabditis remanei]
MDARPTATSQPTQKKPNGYDFLRELLEENQEDQSNATLHRTPRAENVARPNATGPANQNDPSSQPNRAEALALNRIFSWSDAGPGAHPRNDRPPIAAAPINHSAPLNLANRRNRTRPFNLTEAQKEDTAAMKKLRKMNKVDPHLHQSGRGARSRSRNEPYYPEADKLFLPVGKNGFEQYNYLQWNKRHVLQWAKMFITDKKHLAFIEESRVNGKKIEYFLNSKDTEGLDQDLRQTLMEHLNKVRNTYQKSCS